MNKLLIFGGTGFLGKNLIKSYIDKYDIYVFSRDEAKQWKLFNEYKKINCFLGDIRDYYRVEKIINRVNPQRIIIASALKQILHCEHNPSESILTNIIGIQNITNAIEKNKNVESCLFISTDKACAPINVYGMCKAISERVIVEAANNSKDTRFFVCRYGNILRSTGSIIPLLEYQTKKLGYLTITDEYMTRYFMRFEDSLDLIDIAFDNANSGDIWIPVAYSMKVLDLVEIFSEEYNVPIKKIGIRPGEKIHEQLINETESMKTKIYNDKYYIIKPQTSDFFSSVKFEYNSGQNILSKSNLKSKLTEYNIIGNNNA